MESVADWLASLGMGVHTPSFAENEIDFAVLGDLTDQNLKDLGVNLVGQRVKLLRAIAELKKQKDPAEAGESAVAGSAPVASPIIDTAIAPVAERRHLTVMFCDLVGSTALASRLDPEDMRELVRAYQSACAQIIGKYEGFVAQYLGDGIMAYFGYPRAHEHDAEQAVRAALDLVAAVGALVTKAKIEVRVGIATGLVIVGDLIGEHAAKERAVTGETPNLAARLQSIAAPNTVVIAEGTRRLLGHLFELTDLGSTDLKGMDQAVHAWGVVRPNTVGSRFEALHGAVLTALVGREEELQLLRRRWARAKAGEGQVVLVSGEAGIGKSRLTAAVLEEFSNEQPTHLRYFCSPQHTDSAFYPIIGQLERAASFAHDDAVDAKLEKLDVLLAQSETTGQDAALFAELLSLPNDVRYPVLVLTPERRRQRILDALLQQVTLLSRRAPLLMVFEDAHWTDPSSLEAFGRLVDRMRTHRILLVITFRPEFQPPWVGQPHVTSLTLNRLAERDVAALIDRVIGNKPLPEATRRDIVERTDGIPLFVEEMTKAVLEAGNDGAAEHVLAAAPSPAVRVPASLHASLMARLDRLGSAKEIAQIGAAIGREFSHALLAAVASKPEAELVSALDRLVSAGLLFRQGVAPHATYLFKHALVQDAAYGTALREPRRALHARIAEILESRFSDIAETQPEIVARHCTEAGLIEKAAALWGKAGQRSLARSALVEAAEQLGRALDQIAMLPATPTLRGEQIKLQVALITPLIHVKGYNAVETKRAAERARLLIEQAVAVGEPPEDPLLLFSVLYSAMLVHYVKFNGGLFRELAAQFLSIAQQEVTCVPKMLGHRLMGTALLLTGEFGQSRRHYDRAIALYNPIEHRHLTARFGQDHSVSVMAHRGRTLWFLGYPDAALDDARRARAVALEISHAPTLMLGLNHVSFIYKWCGNYARALELLHELGALAEEKRAAGWQIYAEVHRASILALVGRNRETIPALIAATGACRAIGTTVFLPEHLSNLARAHARLGQFDEAWECVDDALTLLENTGERWCEAEVHRVAGLIALSLPQQDRARAQDSFDRSLRVARAQQAKSWELRTATSLARLWRQQGRRAEAHDLLAPIYDWFTEGFDTLDLKEAKSLLEDLASR